MYFFNSDFNFLHGTQMPFEQKIEILQNELSVADAVLIGAGSGLSTAAGYFYSGSRFEKFFSDFEAKFGFKDMYSGGFFPYETLEEFWGFWCRNIWVNRYAPIPTDLYRKLFEIVRKKDYFVLTTNVDHCFQREGFDKTRLFYTQGDYGLFQSSEPLKSDGKSFCRTYDNFEIIKKMILAEGFKIDKNNELIFPENSKVKMEIPAEMVPFCPDDGKPMTTNLRCDDFFVEDEGWHKAAARYDDFLKKHKNAHILFLELGVGMNTPGIIKYPFWKFTQENKNAFYACVNKGESFCPKNIEKRSVCIDSGIKDTIENLKM